MFAFHGLGDSLKRFLKFLPEQDDVLYIALQAEEPWHIGFGLKVNYQWCDIGSLWAPDEDKIKTGLYRIAPSILDWIERIRLQYDVTYDNIFVLGFSLGALLSGCVLTTSNDLKHAILISGAFDPLLTKRQDDKNILSIYITHDTIVPYEKTQEGQEQLKRLGANVSSYVLKGKPSYHWNRLGRLLTHVKAFYNPETQTKIQEFLTTFPSIL